MDNYPDDYLKIYQYLFYMTCPDPDMNPFFHTPQIEKESLIIREIDGEFSTEDEDIFNALKFCEKLYETPTSRAYGGMQKALDRISNYLSTAQITDGKDGNIAQIRALDKSTLMVLDNHLRVYTKTYKMSSLVKLEEELVYLMILNYE